MTDDVGGERWAVAFVACGMAAAIAIPVVAHANPWAGALAALTCLAPLRWIARRLPHVLDGASRRHRLLAAGWAVSALLGVLQMGRLSAFMADPSRAWGSTVPSPMVTNHLCMAAYVHAAALSRRGIGNVYDERLYPSFGAPPADARALDSPVRGLRPWLEDRYLYPPPFLLLPRGGLALTDSFPAIRAGWFVVQGLVLMAGAALLAVWVGGRAGLTAALLIPLLMASVPMMLDLQYGQFHGMAVLLAVAGMVAFDERRPILGGALLSFSILTKIFPVLLVVPLALQRRWRELAWTTVAASCLLLLTLATIGGGVFDAFLSYQLPRLASGAAYAFMNSDRFPGLALSRNLSIPGVVRKLDLLGLPGMTAGLINTVSWAYTLVLLCLAWHVSRQPRTRLAAAQAWLGLLTLASLRAPLAPAGYMALPTLVLIGLLAGVVRGRRPLAIALALTWFAAMGTPPLPLTGDLVVGLLAQAVVVALNCWALLRPPEQTDGGSVRESNPPPRSLSRGHQT